MKRLVNQQTAGKIELNKVKKRLSSSDLSKTKRAQNPLSALSSAQDSRKKEKIASGIWGLSRDFDPRKVGEGPEECPSGLGRVEI